MALIKCKECGAEMSDKAKACPKCKAPNEELKIECPECGEKVKADSKVCPECGYNLLKEKIKGKNIINHLDKKKKIIIGIVAIILVVAIIFIFSTSSLEGTYVHESTRYGYTFRSSITLYKDKTCSYYTGAITFDCTYERSGNTLRVYSDGEVLKRFTIVGNSLRERDGDMYEKE